MSTSQLQLRHLRLAAGAIAALTLAAPEIHAQTIAAAETELIRDYEDAFKPYRMAGILIPIGQEAGDTIDGQGENFVHRRPSCFADLTPHTAPSRLPNLDLGAEAALRLGLGVQNVAEADVQALGNNRVILRFDQVTVQTITPDEFGQTIKRTACPDLARLIDKDPAALADGTALLSEVFVARAIVRVDRVRAADAKISTSWLSGLAKKLGLSVRAEAGGDLRTAQVVELISPQPLPVAFRPAFIRLDPTQPGYRSVEGSPNGPSIVPFNPESENDRLAFGAWIDRNLAK